MAELLGGGGPGAGVRDSEGRGSGVSSRKRLKKGAPEAVSGSVASVSLAHQRLRVIGVLLAWVLMAWMGSGATVHAQEPATAPVEAATGGDPRGRLDQEILPRLEARRRQALERAAVAREYLAGESDLPWQAVFLDLADLDPGNPRSLALAQLRLDEARLERARELRGPPPGLGEEDLERWREVLETTLGAEETAAGFQDRFLTAQRAGLELAPGLRSETLAPVLELYRAWALADGDGRPREADGEEGVDEAAVEAGGDDGLAAGDPTVFLRLGLPVELASMDRSRRVSPTELSSLASDLALRLRRRVAQARRAMAVPGDRSLAVGVEEDLTLLEILRHRLAVMDPTAPADDTSIPGLLDFVGGRAADDRLQRVAPLLDPALRRRVEEVREPLRHLLAEYGAQLRLLADEEARERRQVLEEVRQASEEAREGAEQRRRDDPLAGPQAAVAALLDRMASLKEVEERRLTDSRTAADALEARLRGVEEDLDEGLDGLSLLDYRQRREVRHQAWRRLDAWVNGEAADAEDPGEPGGVRAALRDHRLEQDGWEGTRQRVTDEIEALESRLGALEETPLPPADDQQVVTWVGRLEESRAWLRQASERRRQEEGRLARLLTRGKDLRREVATASGLGLGARIGKALREGRQEWGVDARAVTEMRLRSGLDLPRVSRVVRRDAPRLVLAILSLLLLKWLRGHAKAWEESLLQRAATHQRRAILRRPSSRWGRRPLAGDWRALEPEVRKLMQASLEVVWIWFVLPGLLPSYPFLEVVLWLWLTGIGWRIGPCLVSLFCAPLGEVRPALFKMAREDQQRLRRGFRYLLVTLGGLGTLASLLRDLGMASWADAVFWSHLGFSFHPGRLLVDLMAPAAFWMLLVVGYLHLLLWGPTLRAAVRRRASQDETAKLPWSAREHAALWARSVQAVAAFIRLLWQEMGAVWHGRREVAFPHMEKETRLPEELRSSIRTATVAQVSRQWEEEELRKQFLEWCRNRPRSRQLHAVLGDPGMGKGTFLRRVPEALREVAGGHQVQVAAEGWRLTTTLADERQALRWLAGCLGVELPSSGEAEGTAEVERWDECLEEALRDRPPSVLYIDDVHRCALRFVGGYSALRRLLDICHATADHHFWLLAFSQPTWTFLRSVRVVPMERIARPLPLLHLSGNGLRGWLEGSVVRAAGAEPTYEPLLWGDEPPNQERSRLEELQEAFWEHLAYRAGGNPQVARHYWLEALHLQEEAEGSGDGGETADPRSRPLAVRWVEPGAHHELGNLGPGDLQLLAALYLHDGLDRRHLPRILNRPWSELRERCRRLTSLGVIHCRVTDGDEVEPGTDLVHYRIHIAWWQGVAELLTEKNFLVVDERRIEDLPEEPEDGNGATVEAGPASPEEGADPVERGV